MQVRELPRSSALAAAAWVIVASLVACNRGAAPAGSASTPATDAEGDGRLIEEPGRDAGAEDAAGQLVDGDVEAPGPVCATLPPAPPTLGFSGPLPGASARISEVSATGLGLRFDSGATLLFWWQGPALAFAVGEAVRLERVCASVLSFPCWEVVRGAGMQAAVWVQTGPSTGGAAPPRALPGAPAIALLPGCVHLSQSSTCRFAPAVWVTVFPLQADWQGSAAAIPAGATGVVGPWQVTNVLAAAGPPSMTGTCIQEGGFMVVVTALGPP